MRELVLVVDDENAIRVGLAAMLTEAGYEAIAVGSIGTALKALAEEQPDLLLASLELEGATGLQLVAASPPIPAIVLSSFPDPLLEAEARQLGADYLVTPIAAAALLRVIRSKLDAAAGVFSPARRWERTPLGEGWPVRVDNAPARALDVSYGGVRFEIERAPGAWLPLSLRLAMPAVGETVDVKIVWKRRTGETTWLCGAAVSEENRAWRNVVDAVADATGEPFRLH